MRKHRSKSVLKACSVTHALHDGASDSIYVLLPVLAEQFGLSLSQVGLIRGAHRAAMSLFQLPAGILAERTGERILLVAGTALTGVALLFTVISPLFLTLLMLLFLVGLGQSVQHPLCSSLITSTYDKRQSRVAIGIYNFAGDVGKLSIAGSLSLVLAAGVAWEIPVASYGALLLLGSGVLLFMFLQLHIGSPPTERKNDEVSQQQSWGISNAQGFASLCGIAVIDSSTRSALFTFIPFLILAKGAPQAWALYAIPALLLGGMVGKLACGYLANRIGVIPTVVATELATAVGIILIMQLPHLATLTVLPVLGIVLNGTSSVLYGSVGDFVKDGKQSRAFGLFYTLGSICGVAAPVLYGFISEWYGLESALTIAVILLLFSLLFVWTLRQSTKSFGKNVT